jgi:hypothetical protein
MLDLLHRITFIANERGEDGAYIRDQMVEWTQEVEDALVGDRRVMLPSSLCGECS